MSFLYEEWDLDECLAVRWEEGREEGREEGLLSGAREMIRFGASPDVVAERLNLPIDKVTALQV